MIMSKYKGDITGFPDEVVEWMCDQQVKQGTPRDVSVFEKYKLANKPSGGFTWAKVDIPIECPYVPADFCEKVIEDEEFYLIPQYFPKKSKSAPEIDIDAILQTKPTVKPKLDFDEHRFKAACAAMTGLLNNGKLNHPAAIATEAVELADELLAALKGGTEYQKLKKELERVDKKKVEIPDIDTTRH